MKLLISGANGFVGKSACYQALAKGFEVNAATRNACEIQNLGTKFVIGSINKYTQWQDALRGCDVVLHCAARAHLLSEKKDDGLADYRIVNVEGTLNLARQAVKAKIKRFVFISSIGVNGAETINQPFFADSAVAPHSPYAVSKHEAELGLKAMATETDMEIVIIRPPLIYGLGAPGNFGFLLRWLKHGLPLPLGAVDNKRSFVALDNLVDLILTCVTHKAAANQTFLVSDGEDVSTTELLRSIGQALESPVVLLPIPVVLLKSLALLLGKANTAQSLLGSLQIDISKTCELLNWKPPLSFHDGLKRAIN